MKIVYALMLAACLMTAGCQKKTEESQNKSMNNLRVNVQYSPSSLHPHMGIDLQCRIYQKALFEGLTRLNPAGKPILAGASNYTLSPSQTEYTFTIRPHLWSNGEAVTAYHFEQAWKAAIAPDSPCLRADLFYPIKNALQVKQGKLPIEEFGAYAKDKDTFIVELEHPAPYFLGLITSPLFSPLFDSSESPKVFNGPFYLAALEHDKQMVLKKNPGYWDASQIALSDVLVSFVADPMTAVMLYEKGEIDWVGHPFTNLPLDALPHLEKSEDYYTKPITAIFWLCLNTEEFPLNSKKIRQALSTALNRTTLAQHVLQGETPAKHPIPFSIDPLAEIEFYTDANAKIAKALFEEGLKELNIAAEDFPTLIYSFSDVYGQKKIAEAIQQCWEKTFQIKVQLQNSEWNSFFANLGQRNYQIGGCIWFAAYNDPIYFLEFFKDKNHRYNAPQWENAHFQKLLQLADCEKDPKIRNEHLKQAEMVLLDEMPVIPLYTFNAKYLKSNTIKDLALNDQGQVDFRWGSMVGVQ